jgi:hypothetical protein
MTCDETLKRVFEEVDSLRTRDATMKGRTAGLRG